MFSPVIFLMNGDIGEADKKEFENFLESIEQHIPKTGKIESILHTILQTII